MNLTQAGVVLGTAQDELEKTQKAFLPSFKSRVDEARRIMGSVQGSGISIPGLTEASGLAEQALRDMDSAMAKLGGAIQKLRAARGV